MLIRKTLPTMLVGKNFTSGPILLERSEPEISVSFYFFLQELSDWGPSLFLNEDLGHQEGDVINVGMDDPLVLLAVVLLVVTVVRRLAPNLGIPLFSRHLLHTSYLPPK